MKPVRQGLVRPRLLLGGVGALALALVALLPPDPRPSMTPAETDRRSATMRTTGAPGRIATRGIPPPSSDPGAVSDGKSAGRSDEAAVCRLHAALLAEDAALAADFAATRAPVSWQRELLGRSVPLWAARDLPGAVAWAQALPEGPARHAALLHLLPAWAKADFAGLLEFALDLPPGYGQFQAVAVGRLAGRNPEGALALAALLKPAGVRDQAVINAAATWASSSPLEAASYLATLPAGEVRQAGTLAAVSTWAGRDLEAAVQWVEGLPDDGLKSEAMDRLAFWGTKMGPDGTSLP